MAQDGGKDAIFSHVFMTLTWNLICQSKNTVSIHIDHISWGSDAMIIKFSHTKTDVTGDESYYARHIFANFYYLDICPITALGKWLSSFPLKEDGLLFNEKSYKIF